MNMCVLCADVECVFIFFPGDACFKWLAREIIMFSGAGFGASKYAIFVVQGKMSLLFWANR